jgi:hypothetical protein
VEENDGGFESSDVMSNEVRSSFKSDEMASASAMPALSANMEEYQVSIDDNAEIKPLIVRKSIKKRSGFAEKQGPDSEPQGKLDLAGKKIDAAPTSHSDVSEEQSALAANNENLMTVVKNEKRPQNDAVIEVEIEVSNGNGVNGMARRLGSYLRKKGFKVTRTENANSFDHEKSKVIYYSGHAQAVSKLLKELPRRFDKRDIVELKHSDRYIKIIIGKDMIPYDRVISNAVSVNNKS